jgi:hypothetical protein
MAVRAFFIGTKWSWRNVSARIPDRECIFMSDGTFNADGRVLTDGLK